MGVAPGRCEGGVHCWLIGLELDPELMEWEGVRAMAGCFSAGFCEFEGSWLFCGRGGCLDASEAVVAGVGGAPYGEWLYGVGCVELLAAWP